MKGLISKTPGSALFLNILGLKYLPGRIVRLAGLLEIPPAPPSHAGFAEELLAGGAPLALY